MSIPPSAPRIELTDPAAYQQKLKDQLGGRDPLEVMSQTPGVLAALLEGRAPEALRTRPFPGKWTPLEILGHLADTEWVYGYRLRQILCHDNPRILGMDQELWVTGQRRNEQDPKHVLAEFTALRYANVALFRRLSPAELARQGLHEERGPESLELMLRLEAGHDLSHIDQLRRYLQAVDSRPTH